MTWRQWFRWWAVPAVGKTEEMHLQEIQLVIWTEQQIDELHARLDTLEARVDALTTTIQNRGTP